MALPVVKPDRFNMTIVSERPGQARGRVLTAGKKNESVLGIEGCGHVQKKKRMGSARLIDFNDWNRYPEAAFSMTGFAR